MAVSSGTVHDFIPDSYNITRILVIDPGTSTIGFSKFLYNDEADLIESIRSHSLELDRYINHRCPKHFNTVDRYIRLDNLRYYLRNLLGSFCPHAIICESPFFNANTPNAYAALAETLTHIRSEAYDYDPEIYFGLLAPRFIKAAIGVKKVNDKEEVRSAVMKIPEIMSALKNRLSSLDDHSIDTIAIGYSFLRREQEAYRDTRFY